MHVDRRLHNETPMKARAFATEDRHGRDVLLVITKMTYAVSERGRVSVARQQRHIRLNNSWEGPAGRNAILYPADMVDEKPGTDVLLVGHAHPPRGDAPPSSVDVSLRIERGKKTVGKTVR